MTNLFNHNFDKIPEESWKYLFNVLQCKEETLRNNIVNEKGPKKKEKAENALNSLLPILKNHILQNVQQGA